MDIRTRKTRNLRTLGITGLAILLLLIGAATLVAFDRPTKKPFTLPKITAPETTSTTTTTAPIPTTTKPTTTTTKPVTTHPVNCEAYRGLIAQYFPQDQIENALLTVKLESGCNPNAISPTNDHGLFQINCKYHCQKVAGDVTRLYDPETNVRLAREIYGGRGWTAWYAVRGILY